MPDVNVSALAGSQRSPPQDQCARGATHSPAGRASIEQLAEDALMLLDHFGHGVP